MADSDIRAHKPVSVEFLHLVVAGCIDEAYAKSMEICGAGIIIKIFPAGFPAIKKAMIEDRCHFPSKQLTSSSRSRISWEIAIL